MLSVGCAEKRLETAGLPEIKERLSVMVETKVDACVDLPAEDDATIELISVATIDEKPELVMISVWLTVLVVIETDPNDESTKLCEWDVELIVIEEVSSLD